MEHVLKVSLENGLPVTIIYMSKGTITERRIKVLGMDDKVVRAYCYLRQGIRSFKWENILAAGLLAA